MTDDPSSPDGFRLQYNYAPTRRRGRQMTEDSKKALPNFWRGFPVIPLPKNESQPSEGWYQWL